VLVPFGASGPVALAGINVTYAPGVVITIAATSTVTQVGDLWSPADTGPRDGASDCTTRSNRSERRSS